MHRIAWLIFAAAHLALAGTVDEDLLAAARNGDVTLIQSLVDKGAAIEAKTPYGQTPIYVAAMNGHEKAVELLLNKGADTAVKDTFYKMPVFAFALQRKHYGVVKLIIQKGKHLPDEDALPTLAAVGNVELIQAVLDRGKPSQSSLDKSYDLALQQKKTEIAELLKKAGAQEPAPGAEVDAKVLESYAGMYKTEQFPLDIKVFVKDGKLYMQATGQPEFVPKAKSATVFEFAAAKLEVEFDSAASFTLKQGGMNLKYKKVTAP